MPVYDLWTPSNKEMLKYFAISVLLLAVIGNLFYRDLLFSFLLAGLSYPMRKSYIRYRKEKKKQELTLQFRDLLYALSASVGAGRPMKEALQEASLSMRLIYGENAPICAELSAMVRRMRESGEPEELMLADFAERSGIEDIRSFADLYSISRKTGGDLIGILEKSAEILLEKSEIQREIQKLTAQKKLEIRIIAAMPGFLILFFRLASPGYLSVLYETPEGRLVMTIALMLLCLSYYLAVRLCRIEP